MPQIAGALGAGAVYVDLAIRVPQPGAQAAHDGDGALGIQAGGVEVFLFLNSHEITVPSPARAFATGVSRRPSANTTCRTPRPSASLAPSTFFFMRPSANSRDC